MMRRLVLIVFLPSVMIVMAALGACARFVSDTAAPVVSTDNGMVQGVRSDGIAIFRGIPFAVPPVGDLRWRSPRSPAAWDGIRAASEFGANCMQLNNEMLWFELGEISEDCLNLNIWTSSPDSKAKLPVMVWIHGGGYVNGSGNIPRLSGKQLAKRGVVLITFNYRLSAFGFMTHPALAASNPGEPNGNYGLQDALLALKWVRQNIAGFGGDPDNVTIFGESAGAGLVNTLLVSPLAEGLFDKAISQSSSVGIAPEPYPERRAGFQLPSDRAGTVMAKRAGVENHASAAPEVAAALRELSAGELLALIDFRDRFTPVVDGALLPDHVGMLFAQGRQHAVPYITGSVSWEASLGRSIGGPFSPENLSRIIPAEYKQRLYPGMSGAKLEDAVFGDIVVFTASSYVSGLMAEQGNDVYRFYMTYVADQRRDTQPGVAHADDIAFVFGTLSAERDLTSVTPRDLAVSNLMQSYWVQFARTGNPNAEGLPDWPRVTAEQSPVLEIGDDVVVHDAFLVERMGYHTERSRKLLERSR